MLPSQIKMSTYYDYRYNIPEGWHKLPEATIIGEGYTVDFFRLSECTIDPFCDALNGWYNIWTQFYCKYTDEKGELSIIILKPEDADKLYEMLIDIKPIEFEHEDTLLAVDIARTKLETLIDMIKKENYAL